MEEAAEAALADESTSFISVLKRGLSPWENQKVYEEVELYIKGRDRIDLVRALEGHRVHIFGGTVDRKQWKGALKGMHNITVHPPVDYNEAIALMKQSKIVLNSSIKNKLGAHERIFTAAACGAAVVTNDNPYIAQSFTDGRDMVLYKRSRFDALNDRVVGLLADEGARDKMAAAGRKAVMQNHTWDHRVTQIFKAFFEKSSRI